MMQTVPSLMVLQLSALGKLKWCITTP